MSSKFNLLFVLLFLFTILKTDGQETYRISLNRAIDTSTKNTGLMPTYKIDNMDSFVVPNYHNYIIKEFYFRPLEYYFHLLQQGKIDQSTFNLYKDKYNEKEWIFCPDNTNNKVQILISLDSQNTKTVIFDMNHNQNFTDDSAFVFKNETKKEKIKEAAKKLPVLKIPFTYCLSNKHLFFDTIYIRPYPYTSAFTYFNEIENKYYLLIQNATSKQGFLDINGDNYTLIVSTGMPLPLYNIDNTKVFINNLTKIGEYYEIGDTVNVKSGAVSLDSLTKFGDTLYCKKILKNDFFDPWKSKVPNMKVTDVNGMVQYLQFDKKIMLIDFWGSWCKPCIEGIPKLKAVHSKFKKKNFDIVSIAYDKKKDIGKLKNIIRKERMNWINIFQDFEDPNQSSLVKRFKIETFPTFILVDNMGNILFRSKNDTDDWEMLVSKLNYLLP